MIMSTATTIMITTTIIMSMRGTTALAGRCTNTMPATSTLPTSPRCCLGALWGPPALPLLPPLLLLGLLPRPLLLQ
jgi:hypothetical protein